MDTASSLPSPPDWSLQLGEAGRICVWIAVAAFLLSAIGWLFEFKLPKVTKLAKPAFTLGSICLFGAFVILGILFASNRLEYNYVWQHGDASNPIQYRIAGIWSGQQGSFLLWACASAIFGLLTLRGTGIYRRWYTAAYATFLACLAGILAYETPFNLNMLPDGRPIVPPGGVGLAPSLLNYWVVIHPPTIFLGFGSLTVLGCYALSALITKRYTEWIPLVRPWAILSLTLVGVGLCMGGFWAYETLGWGGFWGWDPVENTSFVPWAFTAAFVHGIMVQRTRHRWKMMNMLLGGLPFILFVYGTFLTRSGVLGDTSVHSFAEMNSVALRVLLGILLGSSLTFIVLWIVRSVQAAKTPEEPDLPAAVGVHRESFIRLGAIFLAVLGLGAAFGMSVPMVMLLVGKKPKVVEEGAYHQILTWPYIALMIVMAIAPMVAWRGMPVKAFFSRLFGVVMVTLMLTGLVMMGVAFMPWSADIGGDHAMLNMGLQVPLKPWVIFLACLSIFVVVSNAWRITELFKRSKLSAGAFITHIGVAVLMAGLIISRGFEREQAFNLRSGAATDALGYRMELAGMTSNKFDRSNAVKIQMTKGKENWTALPGFYKIPKDDGTEDAMVWPYIRHYPLYDIYFSLNPPGSGEGSLEVPVKGTVTVGPYILTYEKRTMTGTPGTPGATFGGLFTVKQGDKTWQINPTIELTGGGVESHSVDLDDDTAVSVGKVDAASGAIELTAEFKDSMYQGKVFYKPMTILVWGGTFLMAIGGVISAWYRRTPKGLRPQTPRAKS